MNRPKDISIRRRTRNIFSDARWRVERASVAIYALALTRLVPGHPSFSKSSAHGSTRGSIANFFRTRSSRIKRVTQRVTLTSRFLCSRCQPRYVRPDQADAVVAVAELSDFPGELRHGAHLIELIGEHGLRNSAH